MKTLNDLAYASLAVLGRERMESTKRRSSLAWLILALLTGVLSLGFAGPATSALPAQGEAALAQLKERGLYDSLQEALAAADSVGNVTRAVFKVSVPLNQSGAPAVDSGPALTVTSACQ